jgi:hypothetical protein
MIPSSVVSIELDRPRATNHALEESTNTILLSDVLRPPPRRPSHIRAAKPSLSPNGSIPANHRQGDHSSFLIPQGSFDHFQASQLRSKRQRPLNSSPRG